MVSTHRNILYAFISADHSANLCLDNFHLAALLVEALRNKAFEQNIPLMDTSLKDIFKFAKAFNDNLFKFFVSNQSIVIHCFFPSLS